MSEISPYEDLLKFCKEVKEGDIIFGSANTDTAQISYEIEENEKKFYVRMISLALQRVAVNGGGEHGLSGMMYMCGYHAREDLVRWLTAKENTLISCSPVSFFRS